MRLIDVLALHYSFAHVHVNDIENRRKTSVERYKTKVLILDTEYFSLQSLKVTIAVGFTSSHSEQRS